MVFFSEALNKISHDLLPPVPEGNDLLVVVDFAFTKSTDHLWFSSIPLEDWVSFFELLGLQPLSQAPAESTILQTLATKQPAMTPTNIARALDVEDSSGENLQNLSNLIVKVMRTQFIAFIGNVLVAFPVAYLLSAAFFFIKGHHLAGPEKAWHMAHELHPWESPTLSHAAIAGVYLFLAGLISGYYDNKNIYNRIPERLKKQPLLRIIFPPRVLLRFSNYIRNNLGSLAGNFFFGFFLGFTWLIGYLLGLPLDIRHITFSSGNFGIALFSLEHNLSNYEIMTSCLGIAGIGFMNFIVSFGLAMFVAIKSRRTNFSKSRNLMSHLWQQFILRPTDFFFAPKTVQSPEKEAVAEPSEKKLIKNSNEKKKKESTANE